MRSHRCGAVALGELSYACIEAMRSGLPVISSSEGGMIEMIDDGQTGWLTRQPGSPGFAAALRRALDTPLMKIAEMGRACVSEDRSDL